MGDASVYIITQHTKAILTKDSAYYRSRIQEGQTERHSKYRPEEIIDHSCLLYGSTLDGRRAAVKKILKINSKVPIPVIPNKGVYMFPTSSTKNSDCVWVSFYQIENYEQRDDKTYIEFRDGTGLYVNASESSFDLQFKRTSQVIARLNRFVFFGEWQLPWDQ